MQFHITTRRGMVMFVTCLVVLIGLASWLGWSAASPSVSETDARATATQRGFNVTSIESEVDQSQKMSVRFGNGCAGVFYLGGSRGDYFEAVVANGNTVRVDTPSVTKLQADGAFASCFLSR